ncbi:hypothetical protein AJ80_08572 [Polytolypa hystricis UAMH7299]|uniref:Transglycosylase SLT domain-containing protein n=1 Tax=Polytolypa hystricis (strain UAMH7299) TaxID=1447883 RepID=A0A2B7X5H8_POLH7|nr:hypothetical protein AJ80_08572 [Polytolypa hystricis UAMH7299]
MSEWVFFEKLVEVNTPRMLEVQTQAEIDTMVAAVKQNAKTTGLDPRAIFALIIQESKGNVRIHAGDGGRSKGLMQIHSGPTCENIENCSSDLIQSMVSTGTLGNQYASGLKTCYDRYGKDYAKAFRCYNSGSVINELDLVQAGVSTPSYVSDVGNRLRGVVEPEKNCAYPAPGPG